MGSIHECIDKICENGLMDMLIVMGKHWAEISKCALLELRDPKNIDLSSDDIKHKLLGAMDTSIVIDLAIEELVWQLKGSSNMIELTIKIRKLECGKVIAGQLLYKMYNPDIKKLFDDFANNPNEEIQKEIDECITKYCDNVLDDIGYHMRKSINTTFHKLLFEDVVFTHQNKYINKICNDDILENLYELESVLPFAIKGLANRFCNASTHNSVLDVVRTIEFENVETTKIIKEKLVLEIFKQNLQEKFNEQEKSEK